MFEDDLFAGSIFPPGTDSDEEVLGVEDANEGGEEGLEDAKVEDLVGQAV